VSARRLRELHRRLAAHYGPQHWWPAESAFEVAVGAVLTQNTAWRNVEAAIANLKAAGVLSPGGLLALAPEELAGFIRPAGYYRLKERRLRNLLEMLEAAGGLEALAALPLPEARARLLAVNGVGPETADSILLYALDRPAFVVDAYTGRILARHGLAPERAAYRELQERFTRAFPPDAALYNELHALLVRLGARRCRRSRPRCEGCPLEGWPG
jgi:endonuclease-3 related protein